VCLPRRPADDSQNRDATQAIRRVDVLANRLLRPITRNN